MINYGMTGHSMSTVPVSLPTNSDFFHIS